MITSQREEKNVAIAKSSIVNRNEQIGNNEKSILINYKLFDRRFIVCDDGLT